MTQTPLNRDEILSTLTERLRALDYVDAMWEIGAVAFDRLDEYSDIDLMISGADDKIEEIIQYFERILNQISPIEIQWRVPGTIEFGHTQLFYRLLNASPYLLIDVVFMKSSAEQKFLVPQIHNPPYVYFDKRDIIQPEPFDADEFLAKLKSHTEQLRARFGLFQALIKKEIYRNQAIEAIGYYQNVCTRSVLELCKIKYSPTRYNFGVRYVYDELPQIILSELESLFFVSNLEELAAKQARAEELFTEIYDSLDWDEIESAVNSASNI